MNEPKSKIAIISQSLGGGGVERFAGSLSSMLAGLGHEIHHIIIEDKIYYDYSGALLNLGKIRSKFSKIEKALNMRKYLIEHQIDTIIDNRPRNSFIRDYISKLIFGNRRKIYIIHSYNLETYIPKSQLLAGILYGKVYKIICVSKAIEEKVKLNYGFSNTETIHNPIDLPTESFGDAATSEKYILFFGRLEEKVKNFTLMIDAFAASEIYKKGYQLLIMGDGPDNNFILEKIKNVGLENAIQILRFHKDPYGYVKSAMATILTSNYEGFPMSIIESLALGTPVISVDCQSGPSEIIINEVNGLLVENHNVKALANAMAKFADDRNLYDICKSNAAKSVTHLSPQNIAVQWQSILS